MRITMSLWFLVLTVTACNRAGGDAKVPAQDGKRDSGAPNRSDPDEGFVASADLSEVSVLLTGSELGPCEKKSKGKVYFVSDVKAFKHCDGDAWNELELKGEKGVAGSAGRDGKGALVQVTTEAAGSNCTSGGQRFVAGLDGNGDGVLQSDEIVATSYICHGSTPSGTTFYARLVKVTTESPGGNCTLGGQKFETGADNGGGGGIANDGALQAGEVLSTAYSCNGLQGAQGAQGVQGTEGSPGKNSLIATAAEPPGANCPVGGVKVSVGIDNGDGSGIAGDNLLQSGEVDQNSYLCTTAEKKNLRFTRSMPSSDNTDTAKDSLCESEFGSTYQAAKPHEVALYFGGRFESRHFALRGSSAAHYIRDDNNYDEYSLFSTGSANTVSVACILKYAQIRFTATAVASTDADAVKDSTCSAEFGSLYKAAETNDVLSSTLRIKLSWFNLAVTPAASVSATQYGRYTVSFTNVTTTLACIRD